MGKLIYGFKETDLGLIPIDWNILKLGDVASFNNGKAHEQFIDDNGDYIVINSKFISTQGEVFKCSNSALQLLEKNEITMVMSDIPNGKALAKCFIVDQNNKYSLNQRICSLKSIKCDSKYLYWVLDRNKYFLAFDSGTGQTNLKKQEVLDCPISVPSIKTEQIAIATALSDADSYISSLEKLIAKKRDIKQGTIQNLFASRKGWTNTPFPQLTDGSDGIKIGPFGSQLKKELLTKSGYKVYGQENVFENDVNVGDRYISKEHFKKLSSCELRSGDFVISMMGTVGKCMIMPNNTEIGLMDSHLIRIRLNDRKIDANFLLHFFSSSALITQVKSLSVGGIMEGLSSKIIKQIVVPLPSSRAEQTEMALILTNMDDEIASLYLKLNKAKMIKKGMMQQLLTGKIRLI